MLIEWGLELDRRTIVQTWISSQSVLKAIQAGHDVIAGNYQYWYLDCGRGLWLDVKPESYQTHFPFQDYCNPYKNWKLIYSYDPLGGLHNATEREKKRVLGGEVHMWSEMTDPVNMDVEIWPRASAAAEVILHRLPLSKY